MKTKKINELMMMETVSDAANVLVEENGEAKRVPAGKMVAGSLPEHLQFGETVVGGDTLTWDGDPADLESIDVSGDGSALLCKVSDSTPQTDAFQNGIVMVTPSATISLTYDEMVAQGWTFGEDGMVNANTNFFVVPSDNYNFNGVVIPSKGTYFLCVPAASHYVSSLTIPGYTGFVTKTVKPLDEKYLPDNVKTPAVTTDDNGKFLRVVDGAWAAEAVPNAEEASF